MPAQLAPSLPLFLIAPPPPPSPPGPWSPAPLLLSTPYSAQQRSWLYRIRPSVTHEPFHPLEFPTETLTADFTSAAVTPNQLRWRPFPVPGAPVDFVRGLTTICGAGRWGQNRHSDMYLPGAS